MLTRFIRVVLSVHSANQFFDYRLTDQQSVLPYQWVFVPFRRKVRLAFVVAVNVVPAVPEDRCLAVDSIVEWPPMPEAWYLLLEFSARYYHHPLGPTVLSSVPLDFKKKKDQNRTLLFYSLTEKGEELCASTQPQDSLMAHMCHTISFLGTCSLSYLSGLFLSPNRVLKKLLAHKWVKMTRYALQDAPVQKKNFDFFSDLSLSPEQSAALSHFPCDSFGVHLLHGVTGSGKTNVYLDFVKKVRAAKRQVLILVPEIGLISQTYERVKKTFPGSFSIFCSSAVPEKNKSQDWLNCFCGAVEIVVGTRSALFFPFLCLGLIVVDEEHDPSYKQEDRLRYHARDLAIWYGREKNIPVLLVSATPSLESVKKVIDKKYSFSFLSRRPCAQNLPSISLVNIQNQSLICGFAPELLNEISDTVARGEQSLIFINRRGFSPTMRCLHCAWHAVCAHCSVRLVFHKAKRILSCHHCGFCHPVLSHCPQCGNSDLSLWGIGTQRVEDVLSRHFPDVSLLRVDRDTVKSQADFEHVLQKINQRAVQIIIGTQMMAKGHHFEHLTHVGVLDADYLLFSPLLRAPEHLFSLLLQVSGRSGRGNRAGSVSIQTAYPQLPVYQKLLTQDYWSFAKELLLQRKRNVLPPYSYQAFLCGRHHVESRLWDWAEYCRSCFSGGHLSVVLYDPVPMHPFKVARSFRIRFLMESESRTLLHQFILLWSEHISKSTFRDIVWHFDIDPLES